MKSQEVYILSYTKYGDNDAIIYCFCEDEGFQSYFIRGIYSKKNKKKAYLLPLNKVKLFCQDKTFGSIKLATKLDPINQEDFYTNIKTNTVIFFVADFLTQILRNENQNEAIFNCIEEFLNELNKNNYRAHLVFLLNILKLQGIAPLVGDNIYLDPETGTFLPQISHHKFDADISLIWKTILTSEEPYSIPISTNYRQPLLESILLYYQYHISEFRTPISLEIIHQIFE